MTRLEYFRYRYLRAKVFFILNFGRNEFDGIQFLKFHFIPKKNVKCDYVLNQFYNTHDIWNIGSSFVCIDGRDPYD